MNIITINDVTKEYKTKKNKTTIKALNNVSLTIEQGDKFALLGPNGAGKTTLIRIITTLSKDFSGSVDIGGFDPRKVKSGLRELIGVASQENNLDPETNVRDLVVFQGRLFGMNLKTAQKRAAELIDSFMLHDEKDKKVNTLSGGNKRRLHCALAIVHKPRILFLDEPTVGMDPEIRLSFWKILMRINKEENVTLFVTTQYLEEIDRHFNSMALLVKGKIEYLGKVSDFKKQVHSDPAASLEDSYLLYLDKYVKETDKNINEMKGELK